MNHYSHWMSKIIFVLGIGFMIFGGFLIYKGKDPNSIFYTGFICISFSLLFAFISKFKRFKLPFFEAEMWEQKQEEAENLIDGMKSLSLTMSKPLARLATSMGYWSSALTRKEMHSLQLSLEDEFKKNAIPEKQIEEALWEIHKFNFRGLFRPIAEYLRESLTEKIKLKDKELSEYPQPIQAGDPKHQELIDKRKNVYDWKNKADAVFKKTDLDTDMEYLENLLKNKELETLIQCPNLYEKFKEELDDLKFYLERKEIRRLQVWFENDPI